MVNLRDFSHVRWFGPSSWGAPLCEAEYRIPIPFGAICYMCQKIIEETHRGVSMIYGDGGGCWHVPVHLRCMSRSIGFPEIE